MQSFVGKLTHACPVYYCSRSARPRALPAGLSVVAADWPHVSNSGYDGSSGLQHHDLGVGVGFGFRHEGSPRRLRRTSRHSRMAGQIRREDREHVLRPSSPWADSGCASAVYGAEGPLRDAAAYRGHRHHAGRCGEARNVHRADDGRERPHDSRARVDDARLQESACGSRGLSHARDGPQHADRAEGEVRGLHRLGHVRRPRHARRDAHQGEGRARRRRRRDREEGGCGARCVEGARAAGRLRVQGHGQALDALAALHQPVRRRAARHQHQAVQRLPRRHHVAHGRQGSRLVRQGAPQGRRHVQHHGRGHQGVRGDARRPARPAGCHQRRLQRDELRRDELQPCGARR